MGFGLAKNLSAPLQDGLRRILRSRGDLQGRENSVPQEQQVGERSPRVHCENGS